MEERLPKIVLNPVNLFNVDDLKNDLVLEMLEYSNPGFTEWVEQTQLYTKIKKFAGSGVEILAIPTDMRLTLTGINKVDKVSDLPVPLMLEFYKNSPFFKPNTISPEQLNTNNEGDFTKEATW